jgi:hypothetical protein
MNTECRNNRVRRHLFVISQNGVDLCQNFIGRFNGLAGQPFVVCNSKKFEYANQVVLGLENSNDSSPRLMTQAPRVGTGNDKSLPALFRSAMNIPLTLRCKKRAVMLSRDSSLEY